MSYSLENHREDDGQRADDPAVICEAAEFALLGYVSDQIDRREAREQRSYHAGNIGRDERDRFPTNLLAKLAGVDMPETFS